MSNKFKVKKKLLSIALALALGAQPLATLPMNVFAGTGKNGVIMAPTVETNFDIDKIIELKAGETFNVNNYVKNIQPQDATVNYQFESLFAFEAGAVLVDDGKVTNRWIAKVKVTVGGVSKETYIIADIKRMLKAAAAAAEAANRAEAAYFADEAAYNAADGAVSNAATFVEDAYDAAEDAYDHAAGQAQTAWNVAKKACESAKTKTALNKGLDLESKLKIAYMAYRVAEAVWTQSSEEFGIPEELKVNYKASLEECKKMADALQKVIDRLYGDKVGDHKELPDD